MPSAAALGRRIVVALLTLMAAVVARPAFGEVTALAVVSRLDGTAYQAPGMRGPWSRLRLEGRVPPGRFVRTEPGARVELSLPDGSAVRVAPESTLQLSTMYFPEEKEEKRFDARLFVGRIWARVQRFAGGENSLFSIRTGNAVAGVRGTAFQVNYGGAGSDSLISVYEGSVSVRSYSEALERSREQGEPGKRPGGFKIEPPREVEGPREVHGPREISRQEWESLVGEWMSLRVPAQGTPEQPKAIDPAAPAEDDFTAWNQELDGIAAPEAEVVPEGEGSEGQQSQPED